MFMHPETTTRCPQCRKDVLEYRVLQATGDLLWILPEFSRLRLCDPTAGDSAILVTQEPMLISW